jgi:glyoxylase-like metal-dependent hydrolase (beta-lactamase superfamily II)
MEVLIGEVDVAPGIRTVDLPGHAPGLIGLRIETAEGPVLLASDACPLYVNWEDRIPPGQFWNIEDCYRSYAHIAEIGVNAVLPGHDMQLFARNITQPNVT